MTDGYTREALLSMRAEVAAAKEQLKKSLAGQPPQLLADALRQYAATEQFVESLLAAQPETLEATLDQAGADYQDATRDLYPKQRKKQAWRERWTRRLHPERCEPQGEDVELMDLEDFRRELDGLMDRLEAPWLDAMEPEEQIYTALVGILNAYIRDEPLSEGDGEDYALAALMALDGALEEGTFGKKAGAHLAGGGFSGLYRRLLDTPPGEVPHTPDLCDKEGTPLWYQDLTLHFGARETPYAWDVLCAGLLLAMEDAGEDGAYLLQLGEAAGDRFDTWRALVRSLVFGCLFSVYISDPGGGAALVFQRLSAWVEGLLGSGPEGLGR